MIRWVVLCAVCFLPVAVVAQPVLSTKSKKAIELYNQADNFRVRGQYQQAIDLLNEAINRDKKFVEAYYRLGLVYMAARRYPLAVQNFEQGLILTSDVRKQKVFWYDLGEAYLNTGQYDKAVATLHNFLRAENQNRPKIDRATQLLRNAEFARQNQALKAQYNQRPLSDTVNCFPLQYFPVLTADQQELIFTRRLGNGAEHDEDLVVARRESNGRWGRPQSVSKNVNSVLNEGTCTISADGRKLIFTSCVGRQSFGSCDLYETVKVGNEWTEPKNLGPNVNSAEWESQPSLSADGRTLYFVSDRRGGLGRRDIWVSNLDDQGQWSKARNLGHPVNTPGDEISPFIHVNNQVLYFASTGHTGFGGYDIFYAERSGELWSTPVNLGRPLNDHEDQFSLFITADGQKGYYSHEESNSSGPVSRIYEIDIPASQQVKKKSNYVSGVIADRKTGEKLKAKIELFNLEQNSRIAMVESDSITGQYLMVLTQGADYALYVSKPGYLFCSLNFNYSEQINLEPIEQNILLDKAVAGSVSVLKNLFFDTDKYDLKEKSLTELEKIVRFLTENPAITIEISGHTDNTGNAAYNRQLSERRAQAVYNYLVNRGIDARRLIANGYGMSRPVADNTTEEGKQLNRRIEFLIR
jgi:outer membrane protein OmpA-like peptidoglycan-associated protein